MKVRRTAFPAMVPEEAADGESALQVATVHSILTLRQRGWSQQRVGDLRKLEDGWAECRLLREGSAQQ